MGPAQQSRPLLLLLILVLGTHAAATDDPGDPAGGTTPLAVDRASGPGPDLTSAYLSERKRFLQETESRRVVGADLELDDRERVVDEILLRAKQIEIEQGMTEPFPPSVSFLIGKPLVEKSQVFDIIRMMPKGGLLHVHDMSLPPVEWVIKEVTYLPNLYLCNSLHPFRTHQFRFLATPPQERSPDCASDWELVAHAREKTGAEDFDQQLYNLFTLSTPNPAEEYPNNTMAWKRFFPAIMALRDLYLSEVTFKAFLRKGFQDMLDDNVQYVEVRHVLDPILDENGNPSSREYVLQQFIEAEEEFRNENPAHFVGAKFISMSVRIPANRTRILHEIQESVKFLEKYPKHFAGYDMAAHENAGGPLLYYIDELLYPSRHGVDLPFFFHAGETNWQGTIADQNVIDAVLLNARRIGHGYPINKHPSLIERMKSKGIAIEINPISNQVLGWVHDLRNHVGASLIADDFPLVISSDNPSNWGALPLSHDYYMAFMGMSSRDVGLTLLKQLALNTFKYSAMTEEEKAAAIKLWQAKWDHFIVQIILKYGTPEDFAFLKNEDVKNLL